MKFGVLLPLVATCDTIALRDLIQALDGAGFDVLASSAHLLAVPAEKYPDMPPDHCEGPFHDQFVLFAYLAAVTKRLHFRSNILILPLYPTVVVAKQSAELQQLSGGRFELGVGISWNDTEYQAAVQDFSRRGKRVEEQIQVLRRLWTEPYVTFKGQWHTLDSVGLNRVPQRPIPIWMGGSHERALRRAGQLADGFIPLGDPTDVIPKVRQYVREAGRDVSTFEFTGRVNAGPGGPAAWIDSARKLQALGVNEIRLYAPPDLQGGVALTRLLDARRALADELGI
jgi:probable F420-dependent oxidoreductase